MTVAGAGGSAGETELAGSSRPARSRDCAHRLSGARTASG